MYTVQKPRSAMIVDEDSTFLHELQNDPKAASAPPVIATTGREAQLTIANMEILIAGIFVNIDVTTPDGGPGGNSVIRFAHQLRPSVPIYILTNPGVVVAIDDFKSFGVRSALEKPVNYTKMLELVAPHAIMFDSKSSRSKENADQIGRESAVDDSEFIAIRAADFVSGSICSFNIYYRFASGKYIKLLSGGDAFSPERLAVYLQKGATYFYLRKEDQAIYLAYCNEIAAKVLQHKGVSIEVKTGQALNSGQETLNFLKAQGLSESNLSHATNFVDNLQVVASNFGSQEDDKLTSFMNDVASYEHGVSTAMITSLLANVSGISSNSVVQIVGISSLLHDIGIYGMPPEVQTEEESKMNPENLALFRKHPELSAENLKKIPGTHPSVIQAVLQHHERRGKKGFSGSGKPTSINRVAELIGIADEYLMLMKMVQIDPSIQIQSHLSNHVFPGFSSPVVEAFRKMFCNNRKSP